MNDNTAGGPSAGGASKACVLSKTEIQEIKDRFWAIFSTPEQFPATPSLVTVNA